jgi:hypothetical protein
MCPSSSRLEWVERSEHARRLAGPLNGTVAGAERSLRSELNSDSGGKWLSGLEFLHLSTSNVDNLVDKAS